MPMLKDIQEQLRAMRLKDASKAVSRMKKKEILAEIEKRQVLSEVDVEKVKAEKAAAKEAKKAERDAKRKVA